MLYTAERSVSPGFISPSSAEGKRLLESNFNINSLRTLDTLTKEEWLMYDQVVLEERERLKGINQLLISRGLTFNLPNALGHLVMQWNDMSEMGPAVRNMDPTVPENDRVDFTLNTIPVYTTFKGFHLDIRTLAASRNRGEPLDTTYARMATRAVLDSMEEATILGSSITAGGGTAVGVANAPDANTGLFQVTGGANTSWDETAATTTGAERLADTQQALSALRGDRFFGPFAILVNVATNTALDDDFKAESDITIRDRLLQVDGVEAIVVSDFVPAATVYFIQLTPDVIRLIDGEAPSLVEWSEGWGQEKFKVFAIQVPQLRSSYASRSGVYVMTES